MAGAAVLMLDKRLRPAAGDLAADNAAAWVPRPVLRVTRDDDDLGNSSLLCVESV